MRKLVFLIFISCWFLTACNKNPNLAPIPAQKPLQIVISNITSTLTIYSFSVVNKSSAKLIDIYSQVENKTYTVNVSSGDVLKLNYFLELEGPPPPTNPVISFIYDGITMATVTNNAGIVSGAKYIVIP